jgi:outer membrane murein-binding lipoprotein Lpp
MNGEENCGPLRDLAAPCALGTLSPRERLEFVSHLESGCADCAGEYNEYERVVGLLGMAVGSETPSGQVRTRLVAYINSSHRADSQKSAQPAAPVSGSRTNFDSASSYSRGRLPTAAASWAGWAVAACLAVLSFSTLISWRGAAGKAERLGAQASELNAKLISLEREAERARDYDQALQAIANRESRVIELTGPGPASEGTATIHWNTQTRVWALTTRLAPAPPGQVYQLWFITADQRKVSAGLIPSASSDCGFSVIRLPNDVGNLVAAAITREPEGGSQQPTTAPFAVGKL